MKAYYQQSNRFSATKAQIEYLRAIHKGLPIKTNGATRGRCRRFLCFEADKFMVKPEIVVQFNLDK